MLNKALILVLIILIIYLSCEKKKHTEHYYDIAPYSNYYDIYKCFDDECLRDKTMKCYNWCDNIEEPGASEACRINCLDASDEQVVQLKYNNYTFNRVLTKVKYAALFNKTDDYVD